MELMKTVIRVYIREITHKKVFDKTDDKHQKMPHVVYY